VATVAGLLIAGCGSSSQAAGPSTNASPPASATVSSAVVSSLTVKTTEYAFAPMTATAKAGKVRITLVNSGKIVHELIVLKTAKAADALKATNGRVSEADSVGEVSETAAGATKSATLTLKPGRYVFVCNIPGHYIDGMRGTLTVV